MLLELYGLPGSGKSTLAKRLAEIDSSKFVVVNFSNKLSRYFYLLLYIINHPVNFYQWIMFLLQNKKLFIYKLHLLFLSLAKMQKASFIKNKQALVDEGLLQRVLTISDNLVDDKSLDKLLKYLVSPVHLIIMEGGVFHRFITDEQKDNSPRLKLGQDYFVAWQNMLEKNNNIIKRYLADKKNLKVAIYNKESIKAEDIVSGI
ncbi:MAG: hypothetical protein WCV71_03635 [Patescibacteria group bacterium]|jgi:hypothetical protein